MDRGAEYQPSMPEVSAGAEQGKIKAFRSGNEFWIEKSSAIDLLFFYFHEVGHILGSNLSFSNAEVMIPDEVKSATVKMNHTLLNKIEKLLMDNSRIPNKTEADRIIKLGNDIINVFSRGNFDPNTVVFHTNLSHEELMSIVKKRGAPITMRFTPSGNVIQVDSKEGIWKCPHMQLKSDVQKY